MRHLHALPHRTIAIAIAISLAYAIPTTAAADIAPANTRVSATSTNFIAVYSGLRVFCTTADLTGTTPARGVSAFSAVFTVGQNGGRCASFGPPTFTCNQPLTLRITAFSAPSASGSIALDRDFNCTINFRLNGCSWTWQGPQASIGTWDFTNLTQRLNLTVNNLAATDTGRFCSGDTTAGTRRGTAAFSVRYDMSTRLTLS